MTDRERQWADKAQAHFAMRAADLFSPRWQPLPHQVRPSGDPYGWLLLAGRMAGKTDACAHHIIEHVRGPACMPGPHPHWIGIIAPTLGDAATACFSGPSGISAHDSTATMVSRPGGLTIMWPNGSEAKLFGANSPEDVERLRAGGNRCANWCEELAAWRYLDDAWNQMRFGLRTGPHPHWVASTTPKPRPLIKKLNEGRMRGVVLTRASYRDNPYIPADIKDALEETYGGTQLGRQELMGELIEEDENALWTQATIDAARVAPDAVPDFSRVSVGVDPSGGAGEQGIVVSGKSKLRLPPFAMPQQEGIVLPATSKPNFHGFVLADRTCRKSPSGWGADVIKAAVDYDADDVVVERNYGGDMAVEVVRAAAEAMGVNIPIHVVWASRGKAIRADPVAAITSQGRWHHAGAFPELEQQMTTWHSDLDWSPDRLDGSVWTAHGHKLVHLRSSGEGSAGTGASRRVIG